MGEYEDRFMFRVFTAEDMAEEFVELLRETSQSVQVAPGAVDARGDLPAPGSARVRTQRVNQLLGIEPGGAVNVAVGLMGSGQGYETTLAQCVAAGLGVEPGAVRVLLGHTDIAPYGMGSRGSRGAAAGGGAAYLAARRAAEKVLAIAAHQLALNAATGAITTAGSIRWSSRAPSSKSGDENWSSPSVAT
jgi:CO/xanthine dehydrogenase Mo-binding subunit